MKKSSYVAMILGGMSFILFALGVCMTLIPSWNQFALGIGFGAAGIFLAICTTFLWRHLTHKTPIRCTKKMIAIGCLSIVGVLVLGYGMCLSMVWNDMVSGILIGLVGIILLFLLIPLTKGIQLEE